MNKVLAEGNAKVFNPIRGKVFYAISFSILGQKLCVGRWESLTPLLNPALLKRRFLDGVKLSSTIFHAS